MCCRSETRFKIAGVFLLDRLCVKRASTSKHRIWLIFGHSTLSECPTGLDGDVQVLPVQTLDVMRPDV